MSFTSPLEHWDILKMSGSQTYSHYGDRLNDGGRLVCPSVPPQILQLLLPRAHPEHSLSQSGSLHVARRSRWRRKLGHFLRLLSKEI